MALNVPTPLFDQYQSLQSKVSPHLRQLYHYRPRTRRARLISITAAVCLFLFLLSPSSNRVSGWLKTRTKQTDRPQRPVPVPDYFSKYPSYHPLPDRPEDSSVALPEKPDVASNDTLPSNLQKTNPSFHVLLPTLRRSPALCRTVTSAMILNYPPPTLISYGKELPKGAREADAMVDKLTSLHDYLANNRGVHDDDFVLIVDGFDFFFQLPPEVMIRRFQRVLKETNLKLQKKYGFAQIQNPYEEKEGEGKTVAMQKYTQRVLFGASKACFPNMTHDAGCITVPQSSLPPDAYGYKTDIHPDGHLNRPRWLSPSTVMGQAADLKLIYSRILQTVRQRPRKQGDYLALTQMYGQQEYVRELERRRTANSIKEWLYRIIGISDASNTTGVYVPLEPGQRYEYGIGVDYTSHLFFNTYHSKRDVDWLRYHNISRTSSVQAEHGVPRERRLLLPADIRGLENPFVQPDFDSEDTITPPHNETIDILPNPRNHSWPNLPLLTNVHSTAVPALIHLDGDLSVRDKWWARMWYQPWSRALLRKYVRSPNGFNAAQSALLGGQEWWDLRGGRGGVWTDRGQWIDFPELCNGFERDVFNDGYGAWGKEIGASASEPVYNQFGRLVKGKEDS